MANLYSFNISTVLSIQLLKSFTNVRFISLNPAHSLHSLTFKHAVDPGMLPRVGVDRGAIKFVLGGANIMWFVSSSLHTHLFHAFNSPCPSL